MSISLATQLLATLNNQELCKEFKSFLHSRHSDENLLFWLDVTMFQSEIYTPTSSVEMKGKQIYEKYLCDNASYAINIDSELYAALSKQMSTKMISRSMFNPAQDQIFKLMETSCFSQFISSRAAPSRTTSRMRITRTASLSKMSTDSLMLSKFFQGKEIGTASDATPKREPQRRTWSFFTRGWRKASTPPTSPAKTRKSGFLHAGHRKPEC